MPVDYSRYHKDWRWISRQIRNQADNRCEFCDAPNGEMVQRNIDGDWMLDDDLARMNSTDGWLWLGTWEPKPPVLIVLTVAHLCRDVTCIDPCHLAALCQKCHLAWDREENIAKSKTTARRNRLAKTGQQEMAELVAPARQLPTEP